jgi:hypothetical protein
MIFFLVAVPVLVFGASLLRPNTASAEWYRVGATDSKIKYQKGEYHYYKGCGGRNCPTQLFVFLPGTGTNASAYQKIVDVMATSGMAAIGLNYYNPNPSLDELCGGNDTCFDEARGDRVYGSDSSPYVPSVADGIENRLLKLVKKLKWTNFYDSNGLLYDRIVFGGHSQGAGMAAWIGKHELVNWVCQFGGTGDHTGGLDETFTPASWLFGTSVTPPTKFFGFNHKDDHFVDSITYQNINWEALGMGTNWPLPLWNSPSGQKIMTQDTDVPCSNDYHGCPVRDAVTPVDSNGFPRYAQLWQYLCGG